MISCQSRSYGYSDAQLGRLLNCESLAGRATGYVIYRQTNYCFEPDSSPHYFSSVLSPRHLVATFQSSRTRVKSGERIDAIYVPTRGRPNYLLKILADLNNMQSVVCILPSVASDLPASILAKPNTYRVLWFAGDSVFTQIFRSLNCTSNPLSTPSPSVWDLPIKRNYALWHANKHGYRRILLVDDDIRGMTEEQLSIGAIALSNYTIAGLFVQYFPDTSLVGHAAIRIGEHLQPFLSGSCLFIRADLATGLFPPIYNEDWIYMAYEIEKGAVCSLGSIEQEIYDPFSRTDAAVFQEPGEVIADGLFVLLDRRRFQDRFSPDFWAAFLRKRVAWLEYLRRRVYEPDHRVAIGEALSRCTEITPEQCVSFILDYEQDRVKWRSVLEELRNGKIRHGS